MARIVNFADGAESETTPTIGNIVASAIVQYPDDATYEASEQGAPATGNLYYNTTIDQIRYYNGAAWITLVDASTVQTLTNKSIDADQNTITNIDNDDIKAGAAIDAAKIHDGSVSNAEFGYLDGVTSGIQGQLDNKIDSSEKGAANGVASLDGSGLVPAAQLPSYVDDVLEFADFASFPPTGETGKIYVAIDTNLQYRWTGSTYVQISSGVDELSDLIDVDTTGVVDGNALVYNSTAGEWQPGEVQSIVQENIALIGKGNATWEVAPAGDFNVAQSGADADDFALTSGLDAGYTFTPNASGDAKYTVAKLVDRGTMNGDGTVSAELYATSGGLPTGSPLATSTSLSTSTGFPGLNVIFGNNFIWLTQPTLTAGVEYAVIFKTTDTGTVTLRDTGANEAGSQNVLENSSPPPDWVVHPTNQDTLYHEVFFTNASTKLTLDADCFLSVPPLPDDRHTIQAQDIYLNDGECAYISIDRSATVLTNRTVNVAPINTLTLDNNIIIFARNVGDECHFGLHDPIKISDGETIEVQKGAGFNEVVYQNSEVLNLASDATFSAGQVRVERQGNIVTISLTQDAAFSSSVNPFTADGFIPTWARPASGTVGYNDYIITGGFIGMVYVNDAGSFGFVFRDHSTGALSAQTSAADAHTSYLAGEISLPNTVNNTKFNQTTGHAQAFLAAGTTLITSTAATKIPWDSLAYDDLAMFDAGNNEFICAKSGKLEVKAQINMGALTDEQYFFNITKNGSIVSRVFDNSTGGELNLGLSRIIEVATGDVIATTVQSTSDTSYVINGGIEDSFLEISYQPDFSIYGVTGEKNKIQTKILTAPRQTDGVIPDLTFNNLVIGKWYEVRGKIDLVLDVAVADVDAIIEHKNGAVIVDTTAFTIRESADTDNDQAAFGISYVFQASSSSLTFEGVSLSTGAIVNGNGTRARTYVQLEERNDLIETGEF